MWTKCNRYGLIGKRGCVLTVAIYDGDNLTGFRYLSRRLYRALSVTRYIPHCEMSDAELLALEQDLDSQDVIDDLKLADDIIAHAKSIGYTFNIRCE